ncbi:MAG TPA: cellulase family glycosylhydrolase [Terriglobia bacterium]|nr:cellulase family glycosylhydrolase [Terriglobia bacterium]
MGPRTSPLDPYRSRARSWNRRTFPCLVLALAAATPAVRAQAASSATVADKLGVTIHFTVPQPGEIEALRATGVRWVRSDFNWTATEPSRGVYDFSAYDPLVADLQSAGLGAVFILDYVNPLYDHGLSPATEEARAAFARWAVAAIAHFRGRHILWEVYNEPNFHFWTPRPNTNDYIKLALAVGEAVRESAPDARLAGPASAAIDMPFLEACFKAGLLNYWSAVSIHIYTPGDPEGVANDLLQVRLLMRKYQPAGKVIPVIVTEWGYSSVWQGMDEQKQPEMLARGWLTQIANDEPLSLWYDWESGGDPRDPEQHFGLNGPPATANGSVAYPRKPAYRAARTLTRMLGDFRFNKRLTLEKPEDHMLLFSKGSEVRLAVWTTGPPHEAVLPASAGSFQVTGLTGESLAAAVADRRGLTLTLTSQPQYLVPDAPNDLLAVAAAWQRLPTDIEMRKPGVLTLHVPLKNPLSKVERVRVRGAGGSSFGPTLKTDPGETADLTIRLQGALRSADPEPAGLELEVRGLGSVAQSTMLVAENPLRATLLPVTRTSLPVVITSLSRDGFDGLVAVTRGDGIHFRGNSTKVHLAPGPNSVTAELPFDRPPESAYEVGIRLIDEDGDAVLEVAPSRFLAIGNLADYRLKAEGPQSSGSSLESALPPGGPPEPGMGALRLNYSLPPGGLSVGLTTTDPASAAIPGEPKALGFWLHGDGSGVLPYVTYVDSTGQIFANGGGPIDWKEWRYVLVFLDARQGSHSSGANDGVIHYPIRWDELLMLRNWSGKQIHGTLYLTGPTLIYGPVSGSR